MLTAFLAAVATVLPRATPIDISSWFSADDYPIEAQAKNIEGSTTFEVDVDASGKPSACRIIRSSGSPILDAKTCEIVLSRAKFKPAIRHGKPVPSRYSKRTVWRLEGTATGYVAAILDFSKDPNHPTCSVVNRGLPTGSACDEALKSFGWVGPARNLAKVVALTSITTGEVPPYPGELDWGARVGFVAIDLYPPRETGEKAVCAVVAKQGITPDSDPCRSYSAAGTLTDLDKKDPRKFHIEQSVFALQQPTPRSKKCKNGESAAEIYSCT